MPRLLPPTPPLRCLYLPLSLPSLPHTPGYSSTRSKLRMNEATAVMQVRFSYNQKATVKAVIAGAADVGMVGCQTPKLVQCGRQMAAMLKVWVAVYVTCREISARICLCTSPEKDTGGRISRPGVVRASRGAAVVGVQLVMGLPSGGPSGRPVFTCTPELRKKHPGKVCSSPVEKNSQALPQSTVHAATGR